MRIARGISIANTSKPISTAIVYDADAAAFFTAASITDTTQKNAVNQLVLDLKAASIWTKMKALYPVVGGVASSHAVNLKSPGTYNLTFATGWSHTSTGMTPNGATYADTSLIPSTAGLGQNSTHLSYYSRTDNTTSIEIGARYVTGDVALLYMYLRSTSNNFGGRTNDGSSENLVSNNDGRGFFINNRTSNSSVTFFKNTIKTSISKTSTGLPNRLIDIGRTLFDSTGSYSSKQCAFASIGDGLTDAEASNFYNAVQNYQTTLGRQI